MKKLAILGLGHIGQYVLETLSNDKNFSVQGYDLTTGHDLSDEKVLRSIIADVHGVLASTPFFLNTKIALICNELGKDYFDLTESVDVTNAVKDLTNARFVTQCGLAPGMVSIIANHLASKFNSVDSIQIRVGALPQNSSNHMGYYKTWNTEGLINEYIHPCPAVRNQQKVVLEPLTELETISMEGQILEAATTSGGLGSMAESWTGRARSVDYKTLRYPGHWDKMQFLKNDLGLAENFQAYVNIFNKSVPQTEQDYVYILINVSGYIDGKFKIHQYSRRIESTDSVTAIQLTTGQGVMAVLDVWNQGKMDDLKGWVRVEDLDYDSIWASPYSSCYQ